MVPGGYLRQAVLVAAFFIGPFRAGAIATVAVAAVAVLLCASPAPCQNVVDEREDFHNTSYVNTDDDEMKTFLFLADEAIGGEDWPAAVANLSRALRRGGEALVSFGERTYLPGRAAAAERLRQLPADALALYLDATAEESDRLVARAMATGDERMFLEVADRFPFTPASFLALRRLGDLAMERGCFLQAANIYLKYLDRTDLETAYQQAGGKAAMQALRARLYAVLMRLGRRREAAAFRQAAAALAGETGQDNLLESLDAAARAAVHAGDGTGGDRTPSAQSDFDCTGLRLVWGRRLDGEIDRESRTAPSDLYERTRGRALRPRSSVYPLVHRGRLYVFDQEALHAFDLETGNDIFGPLPWGWSLIFGDGEPDLANLRYSGTASQGVLFVTLNRRAEDDDVAGSHTGTLQALDLERDGYLLWRVDVRDAPEGSPLEGMAFTGAPLVIEDRLYLLGTRHGTLAEVRLFGFDARNGVLLFDTFLCSGAEVARFAGRGEPAGGGADDRVELGAPIVERLGVLYCLTNLGVAAAVDAFTGQVRWLFKYNRLHAQDPDRFERAFFFDTGGWEDTLPLFCNGRFLFAPEDSRYLYALAPGPDPDGYIVLEDPIEKNRFVSFIGIDGDHCYFTAREGGRSFVAATDIHGALIWETELFEKEDRIAGRPLLTRTALFVPAERYIYRVDLQAQGMITHAFPATGEATQDLQGQQLGNIISAGKRLISLSNRQVLVFAALDPPSSESERNR